MGQARPGQKTLGEVWSEFLAEAAFHFLVIGFLVGSLSFVYLFVPTAGRQWVDAWKSMGLFWALGGWFVTLICLSCAVRGLRLRIYRWKMRRDSEDEDGGPK